MLGRVVKIEKIVHYDTSANKRFLDKCDYITRLRLVLQTHARQKTFHRTRIVRNFISRGVKMRISARKACVKPHLHTRSDIK